MGNQFYTHCQVCGQTEDDPPAGAQSKFYYMGGQYHAGACYDTLFGTCEECGQRNMSVLSNLKHSLVEWRVPLCDECHRKRFKWSIAVISWN